MMGTVEARKGSARLSAQALIPKLQIPGLDKVQAPSSDSLASTASTDVHEPQIPTPVSSAVMQLSVEAGTLPRNEDALEALVGLAYNRDGAVRLAAVRALSPLALKGDSRAATAVLARLQDPEARVSYEAWLASSQLSEASGDAAPPVVVDTDVTSVEPKSAQLAQKTCEIEEGAKSAACKLLGHSDSGLRAAAVDVLAMLNCRGDDSVLEEVFQLLQSEDGGVRYNAVQALTLIAPSGNKKAIRSITRAMSDKDVVVSYAAWEALGQLENGGWGSPR
eukprot:TRINITY_DN92719_c0_g1_i1.p1 TRINITY_DN92719_c0_g1~~TRINITY_DN92719_c0_g1_i1.p1  ORF type:complete len:278 (+),score=58.28 TRINITY_DN92719_c0_g1_i1:94-927(+)